MTQLVRLSRPRHASVGSATGTGRLEWPAGDTEGLGQKRPRRTFFRFNLRPFPRPKAAVTVPPSPGTHWHASSGPKPTRGDAAGRSHLRLAVRLQLARAPAGALTLHWPQHHPGAPRMPTIRRKNAKRLYRFPDIAKNQAEEADKDRSAGSFVLAAAELWDRNHHHPLQARQKCQRPAQRHPLWTTGRLGGIQTKEGQPRCGKGQPVSEYLYTASDVARKLHAAR